MLAAAHTATVLGIDALDILVEVHVVNGLPQWTLVGLAATAVKESRDRVSAALATSGFVMPPRRVTVNLQPADIPKSGTAFDVPIALALLAASGQLPDHALRELCCLGELGLNGQLRPVRGVLAVARHCAAVGRPLLVPPDNVPEAQHVAGVRVVSASTLRDLVNALQRGMLADAPRVAPVAQATVDVPDLGDVVGQPVAARALEIAAAGGHNLLTVGPPGAGKTMLARRLPGILPPLDEAEALEVLAIHSVAGLMPTQHQALSSRMRPFRAPHHAVSTAALIGGGTVPRPGEVSLAHRGVLFLDELSLFPRHTLEALRQPLEDGEVTIARAARSIRFPSRLSLVAASNPCPCGFAGCTDRLCRCTEAELAKHRARLSGPLADRIDLHVTVQRVPPAALAATAGRECSADVRHRVIRARSRQAQRYAVARSHAAGDRGRYTNASAPMRLVSGLAALTPEARALLVQAAERLTLSARGYHRVVRVARTVADLDDSASVQRDHVAEALRYRPAHTSLADEA